MKSPKSLHVKGRFSALSHRSRFAKSKALIFVISFATIGVIALLAAQAATPTASIEPENGTLSRSDLSINDTTASGGKSVKFAPAPSPPPAGSCIGAPNTPGGADPWGGCFPGLDNTGPNNPSVTTPATLTNYTGSCTIATPNVVIENKIINCDAILIKNGGGGLTIKNSRLVAGFVDNTEQPNNGRQVTIIDSEIHGGTWIGGTVWGSYITVIRSEVTGGQHNVHCENNCTVTDSYLHAQYGFVRNGDESHNNGFLSNGGSDHILRHNSVYCDANCSADINLNSDGNQTNDLVERNLLVAAPRAASCLYAVVTPGDGTTFQFIRIIENIFQRGANGKCGGLDPVNGPFTVSTTPGTNGYGNEWRGNKWDDGTVLNP